MQAERCDVAVMGGGIIGLWCAFRLAETGAQVRVFDPASGRGASWTAAGMLAPLTEYSYGENSLLQLTLGAAKDYPQDVADLEEAAGRPAGYERTGAVEVAWDAADLASLRDLDQHRRTLGLPSELLTSRELRRLEPGLAPGLPGGVFAADDHQVDNRIMLAALHEALARRHIAVVNEKVQRILTSARGVRGVETQGGTTLADVVVLATGARSNQLAGLPDSLRLPVRPVQGQTLRLRSPEPIVEHIVRGRVRGVPVYVVPRSGGEIVIGASSQEAGFDVTPRTGAIHDLLRDAFLLVPGLAEAEWVEVSTGLRPGTPDNCPIVGATDLTGLIVATGHYRNGVLLAPSTARAVCALATGGAAPPDYADFGAERFAPLAAR